MRLSQPNIYHMYGLYERRPVIEGIATLLHITSEKLPDDMNEDL
ncbi:MAG: hypothetical protein JETT_1962 [Candidatus Jettenia ecosi]|uniref:Uncharacterized protein n=1 Tax=Candidatus Jettenia ecosi TaxID=2494326 RepID=A0A533QAL2_9BACT|nr:MAG: hypothetical protein JETT_1962 [Candidatus Jettenia ecosi]